MNFKLLIIFLIFLTGIYTTSFACASDSPSFDNNEDLENIEIKKSNERIESEKTLRNEINVLLSEVEQLYNDKNILNEKVNNLTLDNNQLTSENTKLKEDNEKLKEDVKHLNKKVSNLTSENREFIDKIYDLENQIDDKNNQSYKEGCFEECIGIGGIVTGIGTLCGLTSGTFVEAFGVLGISAGTVMFAGGICIGVFLGVGAYCLGHYIYRQIKNNAKNNNLTGSDRSVTVWFNV